MEGDRQMKCISINGHKLERALLVEDPDVRQSLCDASGNEHHVRTFSGPDPLMRYLRKHPEGLIIAGMGLSFFSEPVAVPAAAVRFDESGSADIRVRDEDGSIERQLQAMDAIREAAAEQFLRL